MAKINYITRHPNYNICPRCGHPAYAFLMDNKYCVGCIHCGLQNGLKTLVEGEVTEQYATQMRKAWNMKCLEAEYSMEAMEELGVRNGDYVLADNVDSEIIHVAKNICEVIQFIKSTENQISVGIYYMGANMLQCLGSSFLVWEILYAITKQNYSELKVTLSS